MLALTLLLLSFLPLIILKFSWVVITSLLMVSSFMMMTYYSSTLMSLSYWCMADNLSILLTSLSLWVTALMFMASNKILNFNKNMRLFMLTCVILVLVLANCFMSSSMFMFYIWFEASLIPTMMLIIMWGYQPERLQSSMYFMIYTVCASLPMLGAISKIYYSSSSAMMSLPSVFIFPESYHSISLAWSLTIIGFLVKLPMYTTHLWLPKAHVEAPVAGSMILAAILLKLGGYGIMRFSSMFPMLMKNIYSPIMSIVLLGAMLTSLICIRQTDLKSLIAYSSVSHMGLLMGGMLTANKFGVMGATAMMVAHAFSSSALFMMANINYEMSSTRSIMLIKGMLLINPLISMWWFLFTIMNMAAPPFINLMSEIMLVTSIISTSSVSIMFLMLISFTTGAYSLYMYSSINHGHKTLSSNSNSCMSSANTLALNMHILPSLFLILKPELITLWFM